MTLYIPLVCENATSMNREEILEVAAAVFTGYFDEEMSTNRHYFQFGYGVMPSTFLEEWVEMDGEIVLLSGDTEAVDGFLEDHAESVHRTSSSRGHLGFTPGVLDEDRLNEYLQVFDQIEVLPETAGFGNLGDISTLEDLENLDPSSTIDTPCLSVIIPETAFAEAEVINEDARSLLMYVIGAVSQLETEDREIWLEKGCPLQVFFVENMSDVRSDTPALTQDPEDLFIAYYIKDS